MAKRSNPTTLLIVSVLLVGIHCATATGRLIYVDATVYGNGTSWANAYMHLRDALDAAEAGDEIRVADGVYRPSNLTNPNDVRTATYQLKNGVAIYGGYAGYLAPDPNERNIELYVSELNGDRGTPDVNTDNCYHVVIGSGTDATAILDGFTITDANANGLNSPDDRGGGMYNEGGSPTVANCTFIRNRTILYGGGMCNFWSSNPTLTDCTFNNNSADDGGGAIFNYDSSPTVTDCNFSANSANDGGAMENNQSSPTLTNCTFTENDANNDGGAMYNDNSDPNLTNCTFSGNWADFGGGGMYNELNSDPNLTNCTFSGNSADFGGGGIFNSKFSSPILTKCSLNTNYASNAGGGMLNNVASPNLSNCTFSGNWAHFDAGGMYNYLSDPNLTNCTFSGNRAGSLGVGGGMYNQDSDPNLTNCIFWGNTAEFGPQLYNGGSSPIVTYCDVQDENPDDGTIYPGTGNIDDDPCFVDADGPDNVPGTADDNLRLLPDSPCIDAGDNMAPELATITTDLDGNLRFVNIPWKDDSGNGTPPIVDMGAYEYWGAIHVDRDRPHSGTNDGSTWDKAYRYLQDALEVASAGNRIWVGQSSTLDYVPDQNSTYPNGYTGPGDGRAISFQLKSGVEIYGGYAGWEATDPDARDIGLYETVLSGDRDSNDGPNFVNYGDNSYHVVTGSGVDETAVLDGFTIRGGNASGAWGAEQSFGGGMYNFQGSPTIGHCTFRENSADYASGAMHNYNHSNPRIYYCTFTRNTGSYAGVMQNRDYCAPTLTNCIFYGNTASHSGAISNHSNSSPTLLGCLFSGNSATGDGGAIRNTSSSNPDLINCTFSLNEATSGNGGGIFNDDSSPTITNCILWGNTDSGGMDESAQVYAGLPTIEFSCIQDANLAKWGPGNINSDPLFTDANGPDDIAGTEDDNLRLGPYSPCIDAGTTAAVPPDTADLDNDGDTGERTPLDLDYGQRFLNDPCTVDTGVPDPPAYPNAVDMGAYEYHYGTGTCWDTAVCAGQPDGDATCDGNVNLADLFALKAHFGKGAPWTPPECCADFTQDGSINLADLFALKAGFGTSGYVPSTGSQGCPP